MRKKVWFLLVLCLFFVLFWAIWNTFLSSFVPRNRTFFLSYDSFRNKAENTRLAEQLPESAYDTKYYWGVSRFVTVAGYGTTLSDVDYEKTKQNTVKNYQKWYDELGYAGEELYVCLESTKKDCVQEEWLEAYNIEETRGLLLRNEEIGDYYILTSSYTDSDRITYFRCMLCNDSSKRIIEVSCIDRNPQETFPKTKDRMK